MVASRKYCVVETITYQVEDAESEEDACEQIAADEDRDNAVTGFTREAYRCDEDWLPIDDEEDEDEDEDDCGAG